MTQQNNNIFLTTENLAFSMPLILVVSSYAYFKLIPLQYGLPILGIVAFAFFIRSRILARKAERLQNLDEAYIRELAGDDDDKEAKKKEEAAAKQRKAKNKLQQRLAAERKARKNKNTADDDADDDDDALENFANGAGGKKKKKNKKKQ